MKIKFSIYTASCLHHAPLWRQLKEEWTEIHFSARWPFHHCTDQGQPLWPENFAHIFWQQDLEDIFRSHALLCYAEQDDSLRGALVECGAALAHSLPVILLGENERFGTWQHHPLVTRVGSLSEARKVLSLLAINPSANI